MKQSAVNDFIFFSEISYGYGLIDSFALNERMICLYDLLDVEMDFINLLFPENEVESYFNIDNNETKNDINKIENYKDSFGEISNQKTDVNDGILELYTTKQSGKYCQWLFHNNDPDPNPSIPHAHGIQMINYRFDPYRNFIYNKNNGLRLIGKEKKSFTIALWNDEIFRNFILMTIRNFINSGIVGRNYNWRQIRGITNPYRLPRKR